MLETEGKKLCCILNEKLITHDNLMFFTHRILSRCTNENFSLRCCSFTFHRKGLLIHGDSFQWMCLKIEIYVLCFTRSTWRSVGFFFVEILLPSFRRRYLLSFSSLRTFLISDFFGKNNLKRQHPGNEKYVFSSDAIFFFCHRFLVTS